MNRLLHIKASPRGTLSRTLSMGAVFIEEFQKKHPQTIIDELNVFTEHLPDLFAETVSGKYLLMSGKNIPSELMERWKEIETQINRFLAADVILLSVPMWNFGMPYRLKHYFDIILQPRYLFRYAENGLQGFAKGKKVVVVSSRGGDYSPGSPFQAYDHLEPHLRVILGFIGITDINFVNAQPMDAGGEYTMKTKLDEGFSAIRKLVESSF